jgi:putative addiction module component (TIGR02574 family)
VVRQGLHVRTLARAEAITDAPGTIFGHAFGQRSVRSFFRGAHLGRLGRDRAAWYGSSVAAPPLKDLLALDVETRLAIVQELWNSIVRDAQASTELPISDAERRELDGRLQEDDSDPDGAISWQDARAQLRQR